MLHSKSHKMDALISNEKEEVVKTDKQPERNYHKYLSHYKTIKRKQKKEVKIIETAEKEDKYIDSQIKEHEKGIIV